MTKSILITGASGLIGSRLTKLLTEKGHTVFHLTRKRKDGPVRCFIWNVEKREIEANALKDVDVIVHLAGEGVVDKRWTKKRKQEILESRTQSTVLLFEQLKKENDRVKSFISASAIGYYGFGGTDELFDEDSRPGNDFLAQVVKVWEDEVDKITSLNIRTIKIRIGIALSREGGALKAMVQPVKWLVGSPLGSGKQYMSWIHIDDLCEIFIKAIESEHMVGSYNATSPNPVTFGEMIKTIARLLRKPLWPPVPGFVLKLIMGEAADVVLKGSKVSSKKIQNMGFKFRYDNLEYALRNLLNKKN